MVSLIAVEAGESVEVEVGAEWIYLSTVLILEVVALITRLAGVVAPGEASRLADDFALTVTAHHEARIALQTLITSIIVFPA